MFRNFQLSVILALFDVNFPWQKLSGPTKSQYKYDVVSLIAGLASTWHTDQDFQVSKHKQIFHKNISLKYFSKLDGVSVPGPAGEV